MSFSVVVPASSANLGPGFDSMALALSRYMTVTVTPGEGTSRNAQQDELSNGEDLVLHAMTCIAESVGRELPPAAVESRSDIPVARGMGSSAAALIAGVLAGNKLLGEPLENEELLTLAAAVEGHADNLAAALFGGAVLAVLTPTRHQAVRLPIGMDLQAVVLIPSTIGFTTDARAVVPERISRPDAVFNASRCALLVHAMSTGQPDLLAEAMKDRWHQPYRAALYAYLDAVIESAIEAGACGASLSGSGPTVLALAHPANAGAVAKAMAHAADLQELNCSVDVLEIDVSGARLIDNQG